MTQNIKYNMTQNVTQNIKENKINNTKYHTKCQKHFEHFQCSQFSLEIILKVFVHNFCTFCGFYILADVLKHGNKKLLLPHSAQIWILNPSCALMRARVGYKIRFDQPTHPQLASSSHGLAFLSLTCPQLNCQPSSTFISECGTPS